MIGFIGRIKKICGVGDNCDDSALILWDQMTPWDNATEWS